MHNPTQHSSPYMRLKLHRYALVIHGTIFAETAWLFFQVPCTTHALVSLDVPRKFVGKSLNSRMSLEYPDAQTRLGCHSPTRERGQRCSTTFCCAPLWPLYICNDPDWVLKESSIWPIRKQLRYEVFSIQMWSALHFLWFARFRGCDIRCIRLCLRIWSCTVLPPTILSHQPASFKIAYAHTGFVRRLSLPHSQSSTFLRTLKYRSSDKV